MSGSYQNEKKSLATRCLTLFVILLVIAVAGLGFFTYRLTQTVNRLTPTVEQVRADEKPLIANPSEDTTWPDADWDELGASFNNLVSQMKAFSQHIEKILGEAVSTLPQRLPERLVFQSLDFHLEDKGDHYLATIKTPGFLEKELHVSVEDQMLHIKGERLRSDHLSDEKHHQYAKRQLLGHFSQSIYLEKPVAADKLSAHYHNEILTVKLPINKQKADQ